MGRIAIKITLILLAGAGVLIYLGGREIWLGAESSTEPVPIELSDISRGAAIEHRHVELNGYYPLLAHALEKGSDVYIPLAPLPDSEDSDRATARDACVVVHIPDSDEDAVVEHLKSGCGMHTGTVDSEFSSKLADAMRRELGSDAGEIAVVELGRSPSIVLGFVMLIGGVLLFGATGIGAFMWYSRG